MTTHRQPMDITDRYLQTLGLSRRNPDLDFLQTLSQRHVSKFAFSSVGPLLGDDLPLDTKSLYERIVSKRRGGYCFEQNGLMYEILKDLGFSVSLYLARVIYDRDIHPGLTHRITLVQINGTQYVIDVGFGPLGPASPVAMSGEESHETFRTFRITETRPGEFHMQTLKDGAFFSLYRFELARYGQADCEVGHFYSHKHPQASFVNNLVVSVILNREVRSLRKHTFSVQTSSGERKEAIRDPVQLRKTLKTQFDIDVSPVEARQLFSNKFRQGQRNGGE